MPKDMPPDVLSEKCPSRTVLNHVTSRWGVLVMIALQDGTLRFSALRRRIGGVSERMLTQSLRLLEEDGFVSRTAHQVVPPHVDYDLTPLGREVAQKVHALAACIEGNLGQILQAWDARIADREQR
ncbi:winged helix-turn-helix transcriptional regulator [Roseinatronobacter alkalisoli]|uniref:Helix-turn-helix domain-containing protein n=1 Tax=Roseinatronobacter alkalisoli TaxID=3028235 RepID=A0ABT5TC44_9RHOB|nr:helix-turn-helix domain-containing protein [Roseinatronobacter sp. HJB301]MDD7972260.1 helix-turn-helix domain-containing protein [Roseinatronobacter sp. HJB301]